MVKEGVIYLNEILDENMELHPLKEQIEVSKNLRQIGLGIFGLGDLFIKLGITYGSDKSVKLVNQIGSTMANSALQQSSLLAKEHGTFPLYNKAAILESPYLQYVATKETIEMVKKYGLRNSQILTIPPTGSTSTLLGVSNGIEPIFQLNFFRKTESLHGVDTRYEVFTQIVKDYMEISGIKDMDNLPEYFITSSDIHYKDRIRVQGAWQKYIDSAISSTVNLPKESTIEEIEDLYMCAWEQGLKGTTVYRSGCLREGVLTINDTEKEKVNKAEKSQQIEEECAT